jgi:hypothetical protein
MNRLGDFPREQLLLALPAPAAEQAAGPKRTALVVAREQGLPPNEAERLATTLVEYAASEEFLTALNHSVPPPLPGESEDQFVRRAKEAIRKLLTAKFGR